MVSPTQVTENITLHHLHQEVNQEEHILQAIVSQGHPMFHPITKEALAVVILPKEEAAVLHTALHPDRVHSLLTQDHRIRATADIPQDRKADVLRVSLQVVHHIPQAAVAVLLIHQAPVLAEAMHHRHIHLQVVLVQEDLQADILHQEEDKAFKCLIFL